MGSVYISPVGPFPGLGTLGVFSRPFLGVLPRCQVKFFFLFLTHSPSFLFLFTNRKPCLLCSEDPFENDPASGGPRRFSYTPRLLFLDDGSDWAPQLGFFEVSPSADWQSTPWVLEFRLAPFSPTQTNCGKDSGVFFFLPSLGCILPLGSSSFESDERRLFFFLVRLMESSLPPGGHVRRVLFFVCPFSFVSWRSVLAVCVFCPPGARNFPFFLFFFSQSTFPPSREGASLWLALFFTRPPGGPTFPLFL